MTAAKSFLLLIACAGTVYAQKLSHPVMLSRDDSFLSPRPVLMQPDTIDILAVMVQFQVDTDERTSGDGRFDLSPASSSIIDPPPRDRAYFQDHLEFLRNYYWKSSKGLSVIRSTVIDSVFTLPDMMARYSPPRGGSDSAVAALARDAWTMVDAAGVVAGLPGYDCYVVFHAGVGRDVDLSASLGFDPTPFDIPSLYIGLNAFRKSFGQSYQGIPVTGGFITNSVVLPETENRLVPAVGGDVLLELSINGLLCASVGSYLGLPDLFNTTNGRTAIGRFGLMDGQSIFSFSGVFPPEPSAWEKCFLGWINPVEITARDTTVSLPAVGLFSPSVVYRVPISSREYFLIENRNRDVQQNGQRITAKVSGISTDFSFARDTAGFNAFDITSLSGVVTDVEDLDWSLPGGVTTAGEFLDGGILIWHIDETIIAQNFSGNTINANPERRGVDVEEADGSQDIGQDYGFLSPGSGSEDGTPIDFWYAGNQAPAFRNRFGPNSYPNSFSNSLANSHVEISNFSQRGPMMTAQIKVGDSRIALLNGFPKSLGETLTIPSLTSYGSSASVLVSTTGTSAPPIGAIPPASIPVAGKLFAWDSDGNPAVPGSQSNGLFAQTHGQPTGRAPLATPAVVGDIGSDGVFDAFAGIGISDVFGNAPGGVVSFEGRVSAPDSTTVPRSVTLVGESITASPMIFDSLLIFGTSGGRVYVVRPDGVLRDSLNLSPAPIRGVSRLSNDRFVVTDGAGSIKVVSLANGTVTGERAFGSAIIGPVASGLFRAGDTEPLISFVTAENLLFLLDVNLVTLRGFPVPLPDTPDHPPAIADINRDGSKDLIVFAGRAIHVLNRAGALVDNFPIVLVSDSEIASHPIVADIDGDGDFDVVAVTRNGLVVAYDLNGDIAPGFPLQAGEGAQSVAVIETPSPSLSATGIGLVVASSDDGSVAGWITGVWVGIVRIPQPWPQYQYDSEHSGLDLQTPAGTPLRQEFFPPDRAYNWPNPVYDGTTYIRYYVNESATVNIKIYDLAGDLIDELSAEASGGLDNDVAWNTGSVQSGVYFARIEAQGSGKNGVAVIKVAVVK